MDQKLHCSRCQIEAVVSGEESGPKTVQCSKCDAREDFNVAMKRAASQSVENMIDDQIAGIAAKSKSDSYVPDSRSTPTFILK